MESKPFSRRRALDNDFAMTLAVLIPMLFWFVYLLTLLITPSGITLILVLALIATLVGPILFQNRLRYLQKVMEDGRMVDGLIRKVYFYRDRGRIHYSYDLDGTSYTSSSALHRTNETLAYREGQTVPLAVDASNPNRAYLRDLYS